MFTTVIFDLDHTLIDRDAAFAGWLHKVCAEYDASGSIVQGIVELGNWGSTPQKVVIDAFLEQSGIPLTAEEVRHRLWMEISHHVEPVPKVQQLIRELQEDHECVVLTNGSSMNQRAKMVRSGLDQVFQHDQVFVSKEIGVDKPDSKAFKHVLQVLDRHPGDCLMIGDDLKNDIAGAQEVGIATCWIRGGRPMPEDMLTDFIVEDVFELRELLEDRS